MRRIPPIALVVAFVVMLGLLPTRWIAPLTGDLSSILWVPLSPIAHGATAMRLWLRPPKVTTTEGDGSISADRDYYRGLWHAEQILVQELEKKLSAYEVISGASKRAGAVRLAAANVLSRTTGAGGAALKLNVGTQQGISAGDVAIVDGDAIVGRIAAEVGAVSSTVISIANRSIGRIVGYIVPADQEKSKRPQSIVVQLMPDAKGNLRGDIDLGSAARPGDVVRVKDPGWPDGAQGMRLGVVMEIKRKDEQPLRGEIVVRPAVDPNMVGELVVKLSQSSQP
ncbi:MAG: hypothetical protein O2875_02270 [Planctomycetota bacterium]|nr:hypothetical protein [Planctomycetota bacterium]